MHACSSASCTSQTDALPVTPTSSSVAESPSRPWVLGPHGFVCACNKQLDFSVNDALIHIASHEDGADQGVWKVSRKEMHSCACDALLAAISNTPLGLVCTICHEFLPFATTASVVSHVKKTHNTTIGVGYSDQLEIIVSSSPSPLGVNTKAHLKLVSVLPCVFADCAYMVKLDGHSGSRDGGRGRLLQHLRVHAVEVTGDMEALVERQAPVAALEDRKGKLRPLSTPLVRAALPSRPPPTPEQTQLRQQVARPSAAAVYRPLLQQPEQGRQGAVESEMRAVIESFDPEGRFPANALSATARATASPVFVALNWFTHPAWYSGVLGGESLVDWWAFTHTPCPGGAEVESLRAMSVHFIESSKDAAAALLAVDPALTYENIGEERLQSPYPGGHPASEFTKPFLTQLEAPTVRAYSNVLARFLSWLNHRVRSQAKHAEQVALPFPSNDLAYAVLGRDRAALVQGALLIAEQLSTLEWATGFGPNGLGAVGQYLMACSLVSSKDLQQGGSPVLSQLGLCTAREIIEQAKALRWVLRGLVMLRRAAAWRVGQLGSALRIQDARSHAILVHVIARCKEVEERKGSRSDVCLDPLRSLEYGAPTVRVVLDGGEVEYLTWDTLRAGVTRARAQLCQTVVTTLLRVGVDEKHAHMVADPLTHGPLRFRMNEHICHMYHGKEDVAMIVAKALERFLRLQPSARMELAEVVKEMQSLLFWLLPTACGVLLRGSDSLNVRVGLRKPDGDRLDDVIFCGGEFELQINAHCSKTDWIGVPGQIFNTLDYATSVSLALFVIMKTIVVEAEQPFIADQSIWINMFANRSSNLAYHDFAATSIRLLGPAVTIAIFRQVACRLSLASEDELEAIVEDVLRGGNISSIAVKSKSSGGVLSIGHIIAHWAGM